MSLGSPRSVDGVRRPAAAASVWVSAAVALVVSVAIAWVTRFVGDPLMRECAETASAPVCADRAGWFDAAGALQSALALVAALLLVLVALRRVRFVRRTSLLVLVLAIGYFFGAVFLMAGGV